jgi:NhaA family Na+:H+ antiporter
MAAPALIYVALSLTRGPAELSRGWAIPCATDIAFSAMVARIVFPSSHPAIPVLLLLAIADDALGLVILAVFYPSGPLALPWLGGLLLAGLLTAVWLRRRRTRSFWPYVIGPGALSWAALYLGGFHPALALVPIVPFMPHSSGDLGLFDPRDDCGSDTLNRFEHWWATPVQIVLLLFGFANAGVPSSALDLARTTSLLPFSWESHSAFWCSRTSHGSPAPGFHQEFASVTFSSWALPRRSVSLWRSSLRRPRFQVIRRSPRPKWEPC